VIELHHLDLQGLDRWCKINPNLLTTRHPIGSEDYGVMADEPSVAEQQLQPLAFLDPAGWEGQPVPERRWLVRNRIPMANVTLLNGDGAAGKTTITLQLGAAVVRGSDWLGAVVDEPGPCVFLSAEEDFDEVHRRLGAIVAHHGVSYRELGGLHIHCMPGEDSVLGQAGKDGVVRATPLLHRLEQSVCDIRPSLIAIEASADVFGGNENDRSQVRQFIGLLRGLALKSGAAVLLLAHPSLSGLSSGTGTSGSTAWHNSVRSRLYFTALKAKDDDEAADSDLRELRVMKSNYGPAGEIVKLRWDRGVFIPNTGPSTLERIAAEATVDDVFLGCLDVKAAQGVSVSPATGKNYAPAVFESMTEAKKHKRRALARAQERLLSSGRIKIETVGPPSKQRQLIVRADHG
jgi:RecA-family ATPase